MELLPCRAHHRGAQQLPGQRTLREHQPRELAQAAIPHVEVRVTGELVALQLRQAHRLELQNASRVLVEILPASGKEPVAALPAKGHLADRCSGVRRHQRDRELVGIELRDQVDRVSDGRVRLVRVPEDELAPDAETAAFRERDCPLDLLERDPLAD